MLNLLLAIMGIALTAFVVTGGIWYFDSGVTVRKDTEVKTTAGFGSLSSGYHAYRMSMSQDLPQADWQAALKDGFIYIPNAPAGMVWEYSQANHWFCLIGHISAHQYRGLKIAREKLYIGTTHLGSGCGLSDFDTTDPIEFPYTVSLTYLL